MGARDLEVLGVADRRDARRDRRLAHVERPADAVERRDHVRRPVEPAQAQRRQAVDLRERAAHHDVLARRDQLDAGLVIIAPHVFGVSGVEHEQGVGRQRALETLDLVERQVGAGRIVGIGEKHDLGLRVHAREDRVDVRGVVGLRRHDRRAARPERGDVIDQESVGGVDRLVARPDEGVGEQVEKLVRAGAAHDARGIEPERAPDCFAQLGRRAVGIFVQALGLRHIGFDRLAPRPERRLVRGQLEHPGDAGSAALARHVSVDRHHAGARFGTLQRGHRKLQRFSRHPRKARAVGERYIGSRRVRREPRPGALE